MTDKELKNRVCDTLRIDFKLLNKYKAMNRDIMVDVWLKVVEHDINFVAFTFPELDIWKNDLIKRAYAIAGVPQ